MSVFVFVFVSVSLPVCLSVCGLPFIQGNVEVELDRTICDPEKIVVLPLQLLMPAATRTRTRIHVSK